MSTLADIAWDHQDNNAFIGDDTNSMTFPPTANGKDQRPHPPTKEKWSCTTAIRQVRCHHLYIQDKIGAANEYTQMLHLLRSAEPDDIVYMYLNTPGGNMWTAIQIISAMRSSQARIVTVLDGMVASAGTLLFLSGDEFRVQEHSLFMLHNYSSGLSGKGHELSSAVVGIGTHSASMMKSIYIPFLTQKEFEDLCKGADFWMESEEVIDRLQKMVQTQQRNNRKKAAAEKKAKAAGNK